MTFRRLRTRVLAVFFSDDILLASSVMKIMGLFIFCPFFLLDRIFWLCAFFLLIRRHLFLILDMNLFFNLISCWLRKITASQFIFLLKQDRNIAGVKIKLDKRSDPFYKLQRTTKVRLYVIQQLSLQTRIEPQIYYCLFFSSASTQRQRESVRKLFKIKLNSVTL